MMRCLLIVMLVAMFCACKTTTEEVSPAKDVTESPEESIFIFSTVQGTSLADQPMGALAFQLHSVLERAAGLNDDIMDISARHNETQIQTLMQDFDSVIARNHLTISGTHRQILADIDVDRAFFESDINHTVYCLRDTSGNYLCITKSNQFYSTGQTSRVIAERIPDPTVRSEPAVTLPIVPPPALPDRDGDPAVWFPVVLESIGGYGAFTDLNWFSDSVDLDAMNRKIGDDKGQIVCGLGDAPLNPAALCIYRFPGWLGYK